MSQDCLFGGRSLDGLKRGRRLDGRRLVDWQFHDSAVAEAARRPALSLRHHRFYLRLWLGWQAALLAHHIRCFEFAAVLSI